MQLNILPREGYCGKLLAELSALLVEDYNADLETIQYVICRSDAIYLIKESDKIVSFALIRLGQAAQFNLCYLGLVFCAGSHRGKQCLNKLWSSIKTDVNGMWQNKETYFYMTTLNPLVMNVFYKVFTDCSPCADGKSYSYVREVQEYILDTHYNRVPIDNEKPFVLKDSPVRLRYSERIAHWVKELTNTSRYTWLQPLELDDSRGDRLLFIGK